MWITLSGIGARLGAAFLIALALLSPLGWRASATPETASVPLSVVGRADMAVGPGHIADLWAWGNFAYLGSFDEPGCSVEFTGVHIIDITHPARPAKVGFIASPPGARANDVKVARVMTPHFAGDVLAHSNEPCSPRDDRAQVSDAAAGTDGLSLYDVTDPLHPALLTGSFLDVPVHNVYLLQVGETALALVASDARFDQIAERDFYVVDISNPSQPRLLSVTGPPDWGLSEQGLGVSETVGVHDVWAQSFPIDSPNPNYAGRTIAYLSYWDAGLVILDITDPASPVFLGDSEYLDPDPASGQPPEGNAHVAVPTIDGSLVFMGDEDFTASRVSITVETAQGPVSFPARELSFTTPLADRGEPALKGPATFVGRACGADPVPPPAGTLGPGETSVALVERGDCPVDQKIGRVARAGYGTAVVFNASADRDALPRIRGDAALGTIPAALVRRAAGLAILGIDPDGLSTPMPPVGSVSNRTTLLSVFDGWGYGRILQVSDPKRIMELAQFHIPSVFHRPPLPGVHTMHNVVLRDRTAYISWYDDGIRVVDFSDSAAPREIAHFAREGSSFWGVYLHGRPDGKTYILGSDQNSGLWIFALPSPAGST